MNSEKMSREELIKSTYAKIRHTGFINNNIKIPNIKKRGATNHTKQRNAIKSDLPSQLSK